MTQGPRGAAVAPRRLALGLLAVAVVAGVVASFRAGASRIARATDERAPALAPRENPVASRQVNAASERRVPAVAGQGAPREAKPVTAAQRAFTESDIPAVAALSVDRQGSPREWLSATAGRERASRDAQLAALSTRARARLDALRAERAATTDAAEQSRLDADIAILERNSAERSAIVSRTVRDERRPFSERAR